MPASPLTVSIPAPLPPAIPDYELVRCIGKGGYGEVWLARGLTGVFRAVKFVWRDRFPDPHPYEREFRGLKEFAAISLQESRQLALLHVGRNESAGFFYYVMELADDVETGREIQPERYAPHTLKAMLARQRRLPTAMVIALGVEMARALAGLHARSLVHRDIKPSNVILVGGIAKLADIGLVATASEGLTFVGTEGYVPPEGPGAPAADVFALGKVLYELATGLDRHEYPRLPPDLHALPDRKDLMELNEIVVRACSPQAGLRHPDATALLDDLLLLQAGKSVRRLRSTERRLGRTLRIAAVLGFLTIVAGTGAWMERQRAGKEFELRRIAETERDLERRHAVYAAGLSQTQRALENDDLGRARHLLRSNLPGPGERDLRGLEWHALQEEARGARAAILRPSGDPGQRIRRSSTGDRVAVHTVGDEVTAWDTASGREVLRLGGMRELLDFSPDGQWIFGTDAKANLRRWSATTGSLDPTQGPRANWVLGLDGEAGVAVSRPAAGQVHQLVSYDFSSHTTKWAQPVPFTGPEGGEDFFLGAFSAESGLCALALIRNRAQKASWRVLVFSRSDRRIVWNEVVFNRPSALCFGRRGQTLICGWGDTGEVSAIDLPTGTQGWRIEIPTRQITGIATSETHLGAGGRNGVLYTIDLLSGTVTGIRKGHEANLSDVTFLPATASWASTGNGGDVRLWPARDDTPPKELGGFWNPAGGGRALCVSAEGDRIAATSALDEIRLISTDGIHRTDVRVSGITIPVAFSSDRKGLWVVSNEARAEQRSIADPTRIGAQISFPFQPFIAGASANGRWIAGLDTRGQLAFCNVDKLQVNPTVDSRHVYPYWVALSPDGRFAATSGNDLIVRTWSVEANRLESQWKFGGRIVNGAFSPDGRHLALLHATGVLEVRWLDGSNPPRKIVTSSGALQGIAFHPSEPRLFLGGRDGTVHVIDTVRWEELTQLRAGMVRGKDAMLSRIGIAGDGSLLAGYLEDGTLRLWRK